MAADFPVPYWKEYPDSTPSILVGSPQIPEVWPEREAFGSAVQHWNIGRRYEKSLKDALPEMRADARRDVAAQTERSKAGFMADALAAGQMQTEAGTEALMAQAIDNQMVFLGDEEFELDGDRIVSVRERLVRAPNNEDGEEMWQIVQDTAYIETLEQAVVKVERLHFGQCLLCRHDESGAWVPLATSGPHAPDCIVPALLEKYPDA